MPTIIAGVLMLLSIAGIILTVLRLKGNRALRVVCIVLCSVIALLSVSFIAVTAYFAWAVSVQEPDEGPIDGQDWRTWRSYSEDFEVRETLTVCLSPLDGGKGYAVYDSADGARIGTLAAEGITGQEEILCRDLDGDGVNELGIVLPDETRWYRWTDQPWTEGEGGGCFERAE